MAELKTKKTTASVEAFLNGLADEQQREDSFRVLKLMKEITGHQPKMWGPSIIGFGDYHYKYASGHEGDCCLTGFSPRKGNLSLYIMPGFERYTHLLKKLGKHKTGKSCLCVKRLADIDLAVLREMIETGFRDMGPEGPCAHVQTTKKPAAKSKKSKDSSRSSR
ncbi:MAG: DUF1801 domain-containing protein [Gemmataceae bacterium]|nr:DUF1801 domain-containing protein [Gemmataceae bacterium]